MIEIPKWQKLQKQLKAQKESGGGSKSMKRVMRKMGKQGMNMEEIQDVQKVVIYTLEDKIIIDKPESVSKMLLPQGEVYQIMGSGAAADLTAEDIAEVSEEQTEEVQEVETEDFKPTMADIQLVAQQSGVSPEEAENALIQTRGNLAKAIILLRQK